MCACTTDDDALVLHSDRLHKITELVESGVIKPHMKMGEFEGAKSPQEQLSHIFIRECARVGMGVCK